MRVEKEWEEGKRRCASWSPQGAQVIEGQVVVTCNDEAGLEGALDGEGGGGRTRGESPSGGWMMSASRRSVVITTLRCVAIVDIRSEGVGCDMTKATGI